jgi:hemerythrin
MSKFAWNEKFGVGIPEIDQQHQKLVELINRVIDGYHQGLPHKKLSALIDDAVSHGIYHFSFEERLQEHAGYPFIKAHQKSHVQFAKRISEFQTRFKNGEDIIPYIDGLLVEWLTDHFVHDDADYAATVRAFLAKYPNFIAENMADRRGLLGRLFA